MSERFGTHHQRYPCGPNSPTTTTHSAHNCSCPNSHSTSDTHVSTSCQPSFPGSVCPVQIVDEAKTPFSSRLQTTIPESILSSQCRSRRHQHFGGVFILSRKLDGGRLLRQFPDLSLRPQIHRPPDLGGQIPPWTQIECPKSDHHHVLRTTYRY